MSEPTMMEYGRAQTAIAMAKGEVWKLRQWMRNRAAALRHEADEIDEFLAKEEKGSANHGVDGWYDTIVKEADDARRAARGPSPNV